jgi:predicted nucleic acid-binding protein
MSGVLLDSDVLIDHLRGHRHLEMRDRMSISVVTRTELYAGHRREESTVKALLERLTEFDVNAGIARRAGYIKRDAGLKIADALIAATALEHKLPLMTRNRRHFELVPDLTLRTPEDQTKPTTPDTPPEGSPQGGIESA